MYKKTNNLTRVTKKKEKVAFEFKFELIFFLYFHTGKKKVFKT